ncbi:MAG: diguanylate cyclase [Synergistaceae bacterium]|jgi:diguanylate cyclase (GGDEF)-like protein/PAS domain S-box-containing protein|nr:diguanylate cyclase [Synergistaceae bacterium]
MAEAKGARDEPEKESPEQMMSRAEKDFPAADEDFGISAAEYKEILHHIYALSRDSSFPEKTPDALERSQEAMEIQRILFDVRNGLLRASRGDFSYAVSVKGFIGGALKSLQAHLNHMAWLTRCVAEGDLDQRMDFMGEFADSFNSMAEQLATTLGELKKRQESLERLTEKLRHEIGIRREAERRLGSEEERWHLAVQCSRDGIWDVNLETGEPAYYSPRLEELTGLRAEDAPSIADWEHLCHPEDADARALFHNLLSGEGTPLSFSIDHRLRGGDGVYRWFMTRGMMVVNAATHRPSRLIGVTADIQERKEREEFYSYRATHDVLTELPNRSFFGAHLKNAIECVKHEGANLAVIMADIDNFKQVNDTMGHHAGDLLLIEIASRLQKSMRESDLVARFGGDEFAMLLFFPLIEGQGIQGVIDRMMNSLHKPIWLGYRQFAITMSMGISICPKNGEDPEELLKRADDALYCSKAKGRDACAYWSSDGDHRVEKFKHRYAGDGADRRRRPGSSME